MRVLIYGLNYAPEPTGIGKYTGAMGTWLAERGHSVDAIVAPPYYPGWEVDTGYTNRGFSSENINGVRVYRAPLFVPAAGKMSARNRILHETSFSVTSLRYWLPRFLQKKHYDVVVAVCQPTQMGLYPWLYSRLRKVPFVFHVQDLQVDVAVRLGMLKAGRSTRALYKAESTMLRAATQVSTITEAMRCRIVEKGVPEERTWLFPNWADTRSVLPQQPEVEVRRSFGAQPGDILALYAGNMGEKQGLGLVLDAANLLRECTEIKFAMVGDGAAREKLKQAAARRRLNNVRFFPIQPVERLPSMLAAGDVHLVVQRREAADLVMPSKLTNILSAGRPSVATAEPGTALYDVLNKYDCGITVPSGDSEKLASALLALAKDVQMRQRLGQNARRYAETQLDMNTILFRFESKLRQLVEEKP